MMPNESPKIDAAPPAKFVSLRVREFATPIPATLSTFVGREAEVAATVNLVLNPIVRLVALTGPGGVGKTRIALQVAKVLETESPNDVAYVELAAVQEPDLVAQTIAETLGIRISNETPALRRLEEAIGGRNVTLVLDNFEQVVAAGPMLIELLTSCPRLTALVTSRTLLNLSGEHVVQVQPLSWHREADSGGAENDANGSNAESEAVQLFLDRAQAIAPAIASAEGSVAKVAEICARLDGLPLAIELAAARSNFLPIDEMLARLEHRLPLLSGGARDHPQRQRTMRDTFAWSYDLLSPEEQAVLRRLSVFVGDCSLDAAAEVCSDLDVEVSMRLAVVEPVIESLVRQSMIQMTSADGPTGGLTGQRIMMLETLREFAEVELFAADEIDLIRERHAMYYASHASRLEPMLWGDEPGDARAIIWAELGNYRAALDWAFAKQRAEVALRLVGALFDPEATQDLSRLMGQNIIGQFELAERALALPGGSDDARSAALCKASHLADAQGDSALALQFVEEALELSRKSGDPMRFANAAYVRGRSAFHSGDLKLGLQWLDIASKDFEKLGAQGKAAWTQCTMASIECCSVPVGAGGHNRLLETADKRCDSALEAFRATGHKSGVSRAIGGKAYAAYKQGEWRLALTFLHDLLVAASNEGRIVLSCIEDIADISARLGQPDLAARLYGAIDAERQIFRQEVPPVFREEVQAEMDFIRSLLGDTEYAREFVVGRDLRIEEAAAKALTFAQEALAPPSIQLTPREEEILPLLAANLSTAEMADQLFVSRRTIEYHLGNIYSKLDVHTRAQALAAARAVGLLDTD